MRAHARQGKWAKKDQKGGKDWYSPTEIQQGLGFKTFKASMEWFYHC